MSTLSKRVRPLITLSFNHLKPTKGLDALSTPFIGAYNLFSIGYCGQPVEAMLEHICNQGPRHGMVPVDPTMDITQQLLPLFDGDAAL